MKNFLQSLKRIVMTVGIGENCENKKIYDKRRERDDSYWSNSGLYRGR